MPEWCTGIRVLVFWVAIGTVAGLGCVYVCGGGQEFTEHSILFLYKE